VSKWILLNVPNAPLSSQYRTFFPGQTIDDTIIPTAPMIAAGCVLWPASDPIVSAAAAKIFASRRACGADPTAAAARLAVAVAQASNANALGWLGANVEAVVQKFTATVAFSALAVASLTTTVSPAGLLLPSNARVIAREINVTTAFAGSGVTGLTLAFGGASSTEIVSSQSLLATGLFGGTSGTNPQAFYSAGAQLTVLFTAVGANLSALTAGSVTIDLLIALLP
jgi:hypothetical protein